MDLRLLRYFLSVAEKGNFTKAAESLYITQPTLSRQMKQLEEKLNTQLFIRNGQTIALTKSGMIFQRRAEEMIQLSEKTKAELLESEEVLNGEIAIGSGILKSFHSISEVILDFSDKYPLVTYDFFTGSTEDILEKIKNGLLDFGIIFDPEPADIEGYNFITIPVVEKWGIVMSKDNELVKKDSLKPKDLLNNRIIIPKRENLKNDFKNWMGRQYNLIETFATYDFIFNVSQLLEKKGLIALSIEGAYDVTNNSSLVFKPLNPIMSSRCSLVWKNDIAINATKREFINYLEKVFEL